MRFSRIQTLRNALAAGADRSPLVIFLLEKLGFTLVTDVVRHLKPSAFAIVFIDSRILTNSITPNFELNNQDNQVNTNGDCQGFAQGIVAQNTLIIKAMITNTLPIDDRDALSKPLGRK